MREDIFSRGKYGIRRSSAFFIALMMITVSYILVMVDDNVVSIDESDIVLEYGFDEGSGQTVGDSSGNGWDATMGLDPGEQETDPGWGDGVEGGCIDLDGVEDLVICNPFDMPSNGFTISMWLRATDDSRTAYPLSYAVSGEDNEVLVYLDSHINVEVDWPNSARFNRDMRDGQWHHLLLTWTSTNGTIDCFVDGNLEGSDTLSEGVSVESGGSLMIGYEQDEVGGGFEKNQGFTGSIDEVMIIGRYIDGEEAVTFFSDHNMPPHGLELSPGSGFIDLTWDDVNDPDLDHYNIYGVGGDLVSNGLRGHYYNNENLTDLAGTSVDEVMDFDWEGEPFSGVDPSSFSASFRGYINVEKMGTHTFYTNSDDGVRLWVGGRLLVDEWKETSGREYDGDVHLEMGLHSLRLDYFQMSGDPSLSLEVDGPGSPRMLVPSSDLLCFEEDDMELRGTTASANFRDSGLEPEGNYLYQVSYNDTDGKESGRSQLVSGSPAITSTLEVLPSESRATVGGSLRFDIRIVNDAKVKDWFVLTVADPYGQWVSLEKDELYIEPGRMEFIDMDVEVPLNSSPGKKRIDLEMRSELNGVYQVSSIWIDVTTDPIIRDLLPLNQALLGKTDVMVTWRTDIECTGVLHYRKQGDPDYLRRNGSSQSEHVVNLTGLSREETYEFYVESTSSYGSTESEIRSFTIGTGVVFVENSMARTIKRDYGQSDSVAIKNIDDVMHNVKLSVVNPHDDLIVGFVGEGSTDRVLSMLPGTTSRVDIAFHAQDALDIEHRIVFNLTTLPSDEDEPLTDYAVMMVNLDHVFVNLSVTEISSDPFTLSRKIRIENTDDTVTDLRVYAEQVYDSYLNMEPVIDHGKLNSGSYIDVEISPQLHFSFTPFTSRIFVTAFDRVFHIDLEFAPPENWDIFCASIYPNWGGVPFVEIPEDNMDMDGILDTNDPDIDGDGIPNVEEQMHSRDTDNDGIPNDIDLDDDGDGNPDSSDPWRIDFDNDWYPNHIDPDRDGDGIDNLNDTYPDDLDNDGISNGLDIDDDNDRIKDGDDYHPQDHDNDGKDDGKDQDDDNDGEPDVTDPHPYDEDNDGQSDVDDGDWKGGGKADPRSNKWNPNPTPGGSPGNFGGGGGSDSAGGSDWYCTNKPELDLAELLVFLFDLGMIALGLITGILAVSATAASMWGLLGIMGGFIKDTVMDSAFSSLEDFVGFSGHDVKVEVARRLTGGSRVGLLNSASMGPSRAPEDVYRYHGGSSLNTRERPLTVMNQRGVHHVWEEDVNGVSQIFYAQSDNPAIDPTEEIMITNTSVDSTDPYLHTDDGIFLVYAENDISNGKVLIRHLGSDGTWSDESTVATSSGEVRQPRFDRDDDGLFHVAWADSRYGDFEIMHTYSIAYLHSFHSPERITSSDGHSMQPCIVVDSSDRSHIVWSDTNGSARDIYHVMSNDRGNSWDTVEAISGSGSRASEPTMVMTPSDTIHVAWSDHRHGGTEIYYRKGTDSASSWEDEVRVTNDNSYSELPDLNYLEENLILLWHDDRTSVDLRYFKTYNSTSDEWSPEKRMPAGIPTLDRLFFEVRLTPKDAGGEVLPHDLHLYLDDVKIGSVVDQVPDGRYIFEVPMEVLSAAAAARSEGKLKLVSEHMNPGHYTVAADWRLTWHYTYDHTYLSAPDQYTADMYLRENLSDEWLTEDPAIYANDIFVSDRMPEKDDIVDVAATIRNQGGNVATDVNVRFYEQEPGNATRLINETSIASLLPHRNTTVTISWTADRNTSRIYVIVDEDGDINELREDNNLGYISVNVILMVPPGGRLLINQGNAYTDKATIHLSLDTDSANAVKYISLSNDNDTWSDWMFMYDFISWKLDDGALTRSTGTGGHQRTIYARIKDIAGLESDVISSTIGYYPGDPFIVRTSVDDGEVDPDSPVWMEFSNPMDDQLVRDNFMTDPDVDGSFSWNGTIMLFTPSEGWEEGTEYRVDMYKDAEDFAGRGLNRSYNWTFIVVEGADDDELPGEDRDGDGIPDTWEDLHGLNSSDPTDAGEDPDGDGRTNLEEYQDGTDPRVEDTPGDDSKVGEEDEWEFPEFLWLIALLAFLVLLVIVIIVVVSKKGKTYDFEE